LIAFDQLLAAGVGSAAHGATPAEPGDVYTLAANEDIALADPEAGLTRVTGAGGDAIAAGDLDGDGMRDLLVLSTGPEIRLYGIRVTP
jgi:hypothetical protein